MRRAVVKTMSLHQAAAAAVVLAMSALPAPAVRQAPEVHCGIEMRNVTLHVADGVVLNVASLNGEFISHTRGAPPVFDDPRSYTLRLRNADLSMDTTSLTNLLARQALGSATSPVRDVRVTIEQGALRVRGKLQKGVAVNFSMTAAVSAAADGSMRLHAEKLKAVGIPVKGLLDLLGLDVADLMKMPQGSGIRADGDDLLIDTAAILPPPHTEGRLERVSIVGQRLAMRMTGSASPPPRPRISLIEQKLQS